MDDSASESKNQTSHYARTMPKRATS